MRNNLSDPKGQTFSPSSQGRSFWVLNTSSALISSFRDLRYPKCTKSWGTRTAETRQSLVSLKAFGAADIWSVCSIITTLHKCSVFKVSNPIGTSTSRLCCCSILLPKHEWIHFYHFIPPQSLFLCADLHWTTRLLLVYLTVVVSAMFMKLRTHVQKLDSLSMHSFNCFVMLLISIGT